MLNNWKTTMVGILGIICILTGLLLVYFGKATLSEVTTFGGSLGLILTSIVAFFAKDYNVTDKK